MTAFDLVMKGSYLKSMNLMSLQDVLEIRKTDEWSAYITSLKELLDQPDLLLKQPEQFTIGSTRVCQRYEQLAKEMTKVIKQHYKRNASELCVPWVPRIQFAIECGGAALTVMGTLDNSIAFEFSGTVAPIFAI